MSDDPPFTALSCQLPPWKRTDYTPRFLSPAQIRRLWGGDEAETAPPEMHPADA